MPRAPRSNPLALAVLTCLAERPMHPYEIAQTLRSRAKDHNIRLNYGSLYGVVEGLAKRGLISATDTFREGRRPERTVYEITETGTREMTDWLTELIATPVKEYLQFEAGLALIGALAPDEALGALRLRLRQLELTLAQSEATREVTRKAGLPRLFELESEYVDALLAAEAAEFGVFGGAVVNLSIRSGTNQFSGSLFEYYRDESLNARNFFAATKAPFNSHQFGGTFGGPLLRNKAFFFGDYQRLRQDQGRTVIATVPTAEMRRGDLTAFSTPIFDPLTRQPFAGNIIPADRIDPVTRQVADIWPLPNRPGLADNYIENNVVEQEQDAFDIRGDLNLARWGSVFGRYSRADRDFVEPPTGQHLHGWREQVRVGQLQPRPRAHRHVLVEPAQRAAVRHQQVRPRPVRLGLRDPEEQRARHPQRQHRRPPVHLRHCRLQRRRFPAHRLSRLHQLGAHRHDGAALGQLHVDVRQALGEVRR